MTRNIDRHRVVTELFEFRDGAAPAPGAVKAAVNQDKAHVFRSSEMNGAIGAAAAEQAAV